MRIFKRGGKGAWIVPFFDWHARKWRYRSSRSTSREVAIKLQEKWSQEGTDPVDHAKNEATLAAALDLTVKLTHEKALSTPPTRSMATVDYYEDKKESILDAFSRMRGQDLRLRDCATAKSLDEYVTTRRLDGAHEHTIKKELDVIRYALDLAKRRHLWDGDEGVVVPKIEGAYTPKERVLSVGEWEEVRATLTQAQNAILAFIIATSADWGDLWRALRSDIRDDGLVLVRGTKNAKRWREVPIVEAWQRDLIEYVKANADGREGRLFEPALGLRATIRRRALGAVLRARLDSCAAANGGKCPHQAGHHAMPSFSPKDLRRTCCTWLLADGQPREYVQEVLGHASSRMIDRIYNRMNPTQLKAVMLARIRERSTGMANAVDGKDSADDASASKQAKTQEQETNTEPSLSSQSSDLPLIYSHLSDHAVPASRENWFGEGE